MRAHALFGEMSDLVDRIDAVHAAAAARAQAAGGDGRPRAEAAAARRRRSTRVKQEIVATKEGGAITGEERIREHLDTAYGALIC